MNLLGRWREAMAEYREIKTLREDCEDLVAALLFTIGTLSIGIGVAVFIGGLHA